MKVGKDEEKKKKFKNTVFNTMEKVARTYSVGKKTSAISSISRSHNRQAFLIHDKRRNVFTFGQEERETGE